MEYKEVLKGFITVEGCEGVGKSTQLTLLEQYLKKTNQTAVFTREPGGTAVAEEIRKIILNKAHAVSPIVEAYLFAAARADHVENFIIPMLKSGKIVICDRFIDSSLAYQGCARGLGIETVLKINQEALQGLTPSLTIFIDMEPSNSWRKQNGKTIQDDRIECESDAFHRAVYQGFKDIYKNNDRAVIITPETDKTVTHKKIVEVLRARGFIK